MFLCEGVDEGLFIIISMTRVRLFVPGILPLSQVGQLSHFHALASLKMDNAHMVSGRESFQTLKQNGMKLGRLETLFHELVVVIAAAVVEFLS